VQEQPSEQVTKQRMHSSSTYLSNQPNIMALYAASLSQLGLAGRSEPGSTRHGTNHAPSSRRHVSSAGGWSLVGRACVLLLPHSIDPSCTASISARLSLDRPAWIEIEYPWPSHQDQERRSIGQLVVVVYSACIVQNVFIYS
jgi:hypothetical protein